MNRTDKQLTAALALSAFAHALFVAFAPVEPPDMTATETIITTRIVSMPPPPLAKLTPPAPAAPPKPKPPRPKAAKPAPDTTVASLPSLTSNAPAPPPTTPEPDPAPIVVAEQTPPKKEDEKVAPVEPEKEPLKDEPLPMTTAYASGDPNKTPGKVAKSKGEQQLEALPRLIDLNYKAAYAQGDAYPMNVGNLKLRFQHADGKYELTTMGQASGFFRFVYPGVLRMKSVGKLTERGLEPDAFEMAREREGGQARPPRKVVFDREAKLIRLNDKPPVPIEGQVFDVLTFIVQFYFAVPDADEVTLQVVSPTRVDAYTLKRGGKETLDTPQGKIETEIWRGARKSSAGEAEFWLAPSWHYIPFKVRMTDEKDRKASFDLESVAVEANPPK